MHPISQETNNKYYQTKREVRSKITQLLRNTQNNHKDYLISKLDSFNKKIINSMETHLLKIKEEERMFFGQNDGLDTLRNLYCDTAQFGRNAIKPAEILKKNLNIKEMRMLRNDVNYFIKDEDVIKKLNLKPSNTLLQKMQEEDGKKKFDEIKREVGKKRGGVMNKGMLEVLRDIRIIGEDIIREDSDDEKTYRTAKWKKQMLPFDAQLEVARGKLKHNITKKQKEIDAKKRFREENKKIPQTIFKRMALGINKLKAAKVNAGTINILPVLTESKSILIENTKERNKKNQNLSKFREKNGIEYEDEIDLKKKIESIKANFLITNLHSVNIKSGANSSQAAEVNNSKKGKI